jgi:ABC-type transport system involved in multi-copper enzyme maturation permease subunit
MCSSKLPALALSSINEDLSRRRRCGCDVAQTGQPRDGLSSEFLRKLHAALVVVIDQGRLISAPVLEALLFLNPTDLYQLTNLTGFNVSQFSGMAGLAGTASAGIGLLLAGLLVWIAAPLGLATVFFARREL